MDRALRAWADAIALARPEVVRIGYFGSYARGDWGVGSDLDIIIVVEESETPLARRALGFDTGSLPVPTDLLAYTKDEWNALQREKRRFAKELSSEIVWVYQRGSGE